MSKNRKEYRSLTESHPHFLLIVAVDMFDSRYFEALGGLFVARDGAIAVILPGAATAIVTGASAAQERIVRVYIPASRARERHIVERDSLDFPLDGDEQIAYVCWQVFVADVVWTTHVPQSVFEILRRIAGSGIVLSQHALFELQRTLEILRRDRSTTRFAPAALLPLLHRGAGNDLGASLYLGAALVAGCRTRRGTLDARVTPIRVSLELAIQLLLPRVYAGRGLGLHHWTGQRTVLGGGAILAARLMLQSVDRSGFLAPMLGAAGSRDLARPRARVLARSSTRTSAETRAHRG